MLAFIFLARVKKGCAAIVKKKFHSQAMKISVKEVIGKLFPQVSSVRVLGFYGRLRDLQKFKDIFCIGM